MKKKGSSTQQKGRPDSDGASSTRRLGKWIGVVGICGAVAWAGWSKFSKSKLALKPGELSENVKSMTLSPHSDTPTQISPASAKPETELAESDRRSLYHPEAEYDLVGRMGTEISSEAARKRRKIKNRKRVPKNMACHARESKKILEESSRSKTTEAALKNNFEQAQAQVLEWVVKHRQLLGDSLYQWASNTIPSVDLTPSDAKTWPDLEWRGILVYDRDQRDRPRLIWGKKFLQIQHRDPQFARFEMIRTLVQIFAPCEIYHQSQSGRELASVPAAQSRQWDGLLGCMAIESPIQNQCDTRAAFESTWAFSTFVAQSISPLQCQVPGIVVKETAACQELVQKFH